ncbi:MAG TPA: polysaccharide deacetylase family protein [Gaiellaceae bacterium]|nr:polysaccharide deacetylase family protein [Gaiellaceae bacterium]
MRSKALLRDALIGVVAPAASAAYRERPRVRVVSFHDTPADREQELRDRIRWLAGRCTIVPLADAAQGTGLDEHGLNVVLTFDDGLKEHHSVAAPILDELGASGTFFVPTGAIDLIGERAAEYSRVGLRRSRTFAFMSSDDVRELAAHPSFTIGGHTHSHRNLGGAADLNAELVAPKRELEKLTGRPVTWFAYPFGSPEHVSAPAVTAIRSAGYELAFTIVPAFWSRRADPFLLGRDALSLDDSLTVWSGFLRGGYDALSALKYRAPLARVRGELARQPR